MIQTIYFSGVAFIAFVIGVCSLSGGDMLPDGVDSFWDGVVYAILWPIMFLKNIIKSGYKIIKQ